MLIFAALGDAYGAAYEFVPIDEWKIPNTGRHLSKHPYLPIGDGKYTDDTQMSIAVVEAMLSVSGKDPLPRNPTQRIDFLEFFYNAYTRDKRAGYSRGFQNLLDSTLNGAELFASIDPKSTRSGAVMRAAPIGGYPNLTTVLKYAAMQAKTTHDTPIAIECAQAIALAAHYLIHRVGPRKNLGGFINEMLFDRTVDWEADRTEWATVEAVDCARNALTAWRNSKTTTEVLTNSVAPGGDTDTVATIAMSLAWADPEIKDDLGLNMLNDLESGTYGFEYLFDLNHRYVERFCK